MKTHDLKADKLDLMGWIYSIQDSSIIERLKDIQQKNIVSAYEASLKPMSQKELIKRAEEANKAVAGNDTTAQDVLRNEIKNW